MSARLSDGAYAILEKSFRNANIPKPLESVGHRGDDIPFKRPVPGTFFDPANMTDDETISESSASIHDGHDDFTPHFSLSRHGSGLPPTPPTRSHGSPDLDHLSPRPLFADGVRASLQPQKSGLSTPVHHRSPPTPEFTPPTTRDKLAPPRPGLHHYPSSQADSFVTAREAQSASSQNNSQVHLPIDDHGPNNFLDATRSMRLANIGLGVDVPGLENGGGLTVTRESNLDERFGQNIIAPKQAEPQEKDTTASVPINAERLPRLPKTAHLESDSRAREVREGSTDSVESGQLSFPSADRDGQLRHASAPIRLTQATPSKQSRETNKDLHGLASEKPVLASIPLSGRSAEGSRGRSFDSSRSAIDQKASIEIKRPPNKLGVGERRRSNTSSERSPVARRESNPPWTSSDGLSPSSPRRKHIDPRMDSRLDSAGSHIGYPNTTPMSFSQLSDRTDALEVSEATAISIYPHNNNSLLVVQQVARSNSNATTRKPTLATTNLPTITNGGSESDEQTPVQPIFSSAIIPSTPPARKVEMLQVDSPLKNPRAAPAPPAIKFIPPTPSEEADKQLQLVPYKSPPDSHESTSPDRPVRRLSLVQKARRYSESFVQPFLGRSLSTKSRSRYATHRISRPDLEQRDVNLHPFWRPRGFWDDFSSDSEDFLDYEEPLPRGGDTSDTGYDDAHAGKGGNNGSNGRWKPRMMSVRMKGFRGSGGFLGRAPAWPAETEERGDAPHPDRECGESTPGKWEGK
ncbi:hypothetical protein M8818_006495 [Zalaria obscura]|uniref:Uncharacterized protein n=1 Tax=Zalaria obscura TaxID=2024903 RepID=A0ACC3S7S6_9PEZI